MACPGRDYFALWSPCLFNFDFQQTNSRDYTTLNKYLQNVFKWKLFILACRIDVLCPVNHISVMSRHLLQILVRMTFFLMFSPGCTLGSKFFSLRISLLLSGINTKIWQLCCRGTRLHIHFSRHKWKGSQELWKIYCSISLDNPSFWSNLENILFGELF